MKLFAITKTHFTDEGTESWLLGVVDEDNLEDTMRDAKKEILKEFEERYEEEEMKDLEFTETSTSVRGYMNFDFDDIIIEASECELNEIDAFGAYQIV